MIIHGEVIIKECDNILPHFEHSWRTGFLWWRKQSCKGVTLHQHEQWMGRKWPKPKPKHKHKLQYNASQEYSWVNPDKYVWTCADQTCDIVISSDKENLRWALLNAKKATAVKLPPRRNPWQ